MPNVFNLDVREGIKEEKKEEVYQTLDERAYVFC